MSNDLGDQLLGECLAKQPKGLRRQLLGQKFNEQARSCGTFSGFLLNHRSTPDSYSSASETRASRVNRSKPARRVSRARSEEHTSELQSQSNLHSFPTRRSSDLVSS